MSTEDNRLRITYQEGRRQRVFDAPLPVGFHSMFLGPVQVREVGEHLAAIGDRDTSLILHTSGATHVLELAVWSQQRANGDIDLASENMHVHVRASDGSLAAEESDIGWMLSGEEVQPVRRHMRSRWTRVHGDERGSFRFDADATSQLCLDEPDDVRLLTRREDTGLTLFRIGDSPCIESVHVPDEIFRVDGDALQSERRRCLLQ